MRFCCFSCTLYIIIQNVNLFQAQATELETDYSRIQQQYSRLSSEHTQVTNQQRRNFQLYKEQKANEITSLDGKNALHKKACFSVNGQLALITCDSNLLEIVPETYMYIKRIKRCNFPIYMYTKGLLIRVQIFNFSITIKVFGSEANKPTSLSSHDHNVMFACSPMYISHNYWLFN